MLPLRARLPVSSLKTLVCDILPHVMSAFRSSGEECETPAAEAPEMPSPHYDPSAACSARSVHRPKKQRTEFTCTQTHSNTQ